MLLERDQMCQKDTGKEWKEGGGVCSGSSGVLQTPEHKAHSRQMPGMGGGSSKGQGPQSRVRK